MKMYKKHSFTLIELLAVIAITALLIGIFTPAFSRMMLGNKVEQMASNFKTGMEVAQAKAVASRKHVAMVMPSTFKDIDPKLKSFVGGGYRFAFVKKDGDKWKFAGWVPGSAWSNMSDGAMLVGIVSRKDWYVEEGKRSSGLLNLNGNDSGKPNVSLASGIDDQFTGAGILTDLEVDKETVGETEEPVDADMKALGCDENRRALIFSPFGGCSDTGSVLLFFFTEARFTNDNYQYDNEDNFMVMKLNPITGKVLFLADEE
ncbi:MAG: type II secretion system protein [Lentisphaerae bacterium]|nr:type II secretion system protein [Lentisphaerota bacterium]